MLAGALLAACSTSSAPSTTTASATTTTLTPAAAAFLEPKKLTLANFPSGWTEDTAPNAASTQGTPPCLADLVNVKGSTARTSVVFVGSKSEPADVLQTVAMFPAGQAIPSAAALQAEFESCASTLSRPSESKSVTITPIPNVQTGDAGFAARMTLASGSQHGYFDAFYAVKGDAATFIGWYSNSTNTAEFESLAATALAKL